MEWKHIIVQQTSHFYLLCLNLKQSLTFRECHVRVVISVSKMFLFNFSPSNPHFNLLWQSLLSLYQPSGCPLPFCSKFITKKSTLRVAYSMLWWRIRDCETVTVHPPEKNFSIHSFLFVTLMRKEDHSSIARSGLLTCKSCFFCQLCLSIYHTTPS